MRDAGSGVDPASLQATIDGKPAEIVYARGRATISLARASRGRHTPVFRAADYQELKNMENVPKILPNTRGLRVRFTVS